MLPRLLFSRLPSPSTSSLRTVALSSARSAGGPARGQPQPMEEARFSKSAAFQGRSGRGAGVSGPAFHFDYYSTDEFGNKKLLSAILSITALAVYFGLLREPSDLDEILNTPQHILTANLERKMLLQQIADAKAKGESTELLQAELDYVDVKEAALKIQFKK